MLRFRENEGSWDNLQGLEGHCEDFALTLSEWEPWKGSEQRRDRLDSSFNRVTTVAARIIDISGTFSANQELCKALCTNDVGRRPLGLSSCPSHPGDQSRHFFSLRPCAQTSTQIGPPTCPNSFQQLRPRNWPAPLSCPNQWSFLH